MLKPVFGFDEEFKRSFAFLRYAHIWLEVIVNVMPS